jgi:hypothetical protein
MMRGCRAKNVGARGVASTFLTKGFNCYNNLYAIPYAHNPSFFERILVEVEEDIAANVMLSKAGRVLPNFGIIKPARYMKIVPLFEEFEIGEARRTLE